MLADVNIVNSQVSYTRPQFQFGAPPYYGSLLQGFYSAGKRYSVPGLNPQDSPLPFHPVLLRTYPTCYSTQQYFAHLRNSPVGTMKPVGQFDMGGRTWFEFDGQISCSLETLLAHHQVNLTLGVTGRMLAQQDFCDPLVSILRQVIRTLEDFYTSNVYCWGLETNMMFVTFGEEYPTIRLLPSQYEDLAARGMFQNACPLTPELSNNYKTDFAEIVHECATRTYLDNANAAEIFDLIDTLRAHQIPKLWFTSSSGTYNYSKEVTFGRICRA